MIPVINPRLSRVAIIGSGISGLATSILLSRKGYDVHVFEKNSNAGGAASKLKIEGYTFDMGPSWVMMPEIFRWFFRECGTDLEKELDLVRLDPQYKIFFQSREPVTIPSGYENIREVFAGLEENGGEKLDSFMEESRKKYALSKKDILWNSYDHGSDLLRLIGKVRSEKIPLFESFHKHVSRFFSNPDAQKILEYTTVFLGGSPFIVPSIYDLMVSVDFDAGIWYPMGGISRIVDSLHDIALQNNVKFHFNSEVKGIRVQGNTANSIVTEEGVIDTDYVVSSGSYAHTEENLLELKYRTYTERYWDRKVIAPSVLMIYLGVRGKIDRLEHHNLILIDNWDKHYDDIYTNHVWPEDFSFYVSMTSRTDPTVAPEGNENLVVLIPVSAGLKTTPEIQEKYLNAVVEKLKSQANVDISGRIEVRSFFGPEDFEKRYNAFKGTAFGLAHTLRQTAMFRPKNRSRKVRNLFYAGQYTNPGIGMPMVIISASIVSNCLRSLNMGVNVSEFRLRTEEQIQ